MTIEKLAERVTYNNQNYAKGDWRSRHGYEAGFIAGASLAVELIEWLSPSFGEPKQLFEEFLTEKYGK